MFSIEEIKMLAELELKMDTGEQPYVMLNNQRAAFSQEVMDTLGVTNKQTINDEIWKAMVEESINQIPKVADC